MDLKKQAKGSSGLLSTFFPAEKIQRHRPAARSVSGGGGYRPIGRSVTNVKIEPTGATSKIGTHLTAAAAQPNAIGSAPLPNGSEPSAKQPEAEPKAPPGGLS